MHDFQPLTVARVTRETADAISVTLAVPEALREAFAWRPGQHLAFRFVLEGEELRRTYSISSGPDDRDLRVAVKRVAGGRVSSWANDHLKVGHILDVMPPAGRFVLPPGDGKPRHVIAFAAGAGITPIIAIVKHVLVREPHAEVTLVYGNRSSEQILFREELDDLKDRHLGRFTLLHVLSRNDDGSSPLLVGRIGGATVDGLAGHLLRTDGTHEIFLCGPGTMIREVRDALFHKGVARERVHHEFFAAGGGAYQQRPADQPLTRPAADATSAEVVAIVDGMRHPFRVAKGQRIVDAASAAGVRVPYSCKGGMCSTCRARVVEGSVEMAVNYSLEPWETERGFVLTCQSLPTSDRVVLDYDQM